MIKISKYLTSKNSGSIVLIFGLLLLPVVYRLMTYIDIRHGVGLWLDTWGNPNMYVDDPGDGIIVATTTLSIICYIVGYFLTIKKLWPLNWWQSSLLFVGGALVFYYISFLLMITVFY